jgi:hypothetical protein
MKKLFSLSAAALLLLSVACESIDKALVSKMQEELAAMEGLSADAEKISTIITNVAAQINTAPESVKTGDDPMFKGISQKIGAMSERHQATLAEYNDLLGKLKSLSADYSAGKVKTEDAQKEFDTLSMGLKGVSAAFGDMGPTMDQIQMAFAKMSADWNAKAEEETK